MNVLIVFDTYYGNTQKVAELIESSLSNVESQLIKVDLITQTLVDQYDLIVFGSPTRGFNMTKKIKKSLKNLDYRSKKFWVFDTRMDVDDVDNKLLLKLVKRFGYAAEKMENILIKQKAIKAMDYTYYYVKESEGPLYETMTQKVKDDLIRLNETILN